MHTHARTHTHTRARSWAEAPLQPLRIYALTRARARTHTYTHTHTQGYLVAILAIDLFLDHAEETRQLWPWMAISGVLWWNLWCPQLFSGFVSLQVCAYVRVCVCVFE